MQLDSVLPEPFWLEPTNSTIAGEKLAYLLSAQRIIRAIGLLLISFVGVILFLPMAQEVLLIRRLEQEGKTAQAQQFYTGLDQDGSLHVFYTFAVDGYPLPFSQHHQISPAAETEINNNATLTIKYLPSDPTQSHFWGKNRFNLLLIAAVGGFILGAFLWGSFSLWRVIRLWLWNWQRRGRLIVGQMQACQGVFTANQDYQVTVSYEFQVKKRLFNGQSTAIRNDLKNSALPTPGTPITVLYWSQKRYRLL